MAYNFDIYFKVEEELIKGGNVWIPIEEWFRIVRFFNPANVPSLGHEPHATQLFEGRPVIYLNDNAVVLWQKCSWCGMETFPQRVHFGYWVCRHCGGYVT